MTKVLRDLLNIFVSKIPLILNVEVRIILDKKTFFAKRLSWELNYFGTNYKQSFTEIKEPFFFQVPSQSVRSLFEICLRLLHNTWPI